MATIQKFEELEIWQLARAYAKDIYNITKYPEFFRDFKLTGQIRGASGSIMDNIAEGFGRGGNKEFSMFLTITIGSANETQSQLYRALDQNYIPQQEFDELYKKAEEIIGKTGKLIQYLKSSEYKGIKYK
jgi:four helix bundle protein